MKPTATCRVVFFLLAAILVLAAGCGDDDAPTCPEPEPIPVAQFVMKLVGGNSHQYPTWRFALQSRFMSPAIGDTIATLDLQDGDAGLIRTFDASNSPNFDQFAATVTNGEDEPFFMYCWPSPGLEPVTSGTVESMAFGGGLDGDLGPDLAGVRVTKLRLNVIDSQINIPGEDPNADGDWTSYVFTLNFLVYGVR